MNLGRITIRLTLVTGLLSGLAVFGALPVSAQTVTPQGQASLSWAEIRALSPGQDVVLTLKDGTARKRCFVEATDSQVTVLNLADPSLSPSTRRHLRELVATPGQWDLLQKRASVQFGDGTRVSAAAVTDASGRVLANVAAITERIARTDLTTLPEGTSLAERMMPYAAGVMGGASPRGAQVGGRVNLGLGCLVSLDAEVDYWRWIHFDDQNHLTVARVQVRIGPRNRPGWHVAGLVGGMTALNTEGYTGTAGVGIEREYGSRRVFIDAGVGMFTAFVNVGVLFGPAPKGR